MNFPISFRVWSKISNKWMDNIVVTSKGTPILLYSEKVDTRVFHRVYLVDNYQPVIQWSTGLKDKTGREIFEGDIVKFGDGNLKTIEYMGFLSDGATLVDSEVIDNVFEKELRDKLQKALEEYQQEEKNKNNKIEGTNDVQKTE